MLVSIICSLIVHLAYLFTNSLLLCYSSFELACTLYAGAALPFGCFSDTHIKQVRNYFVFIHLQLVYVLYDFFFFLGVTLLSFSVTFLVLFIYFFIYFY